MFVPSCLLWAAAYHKSAAFCFNYSFGSKNKCTCIITNRKKKYRLKVKVHPEPIPITQALLFAVFSFACCSHQRSYRTREGESTHRASRPQSSIVCAFSVKNSERQCVDLQADQDRVCCSPDVLPQVAPRAAGAGCWPGPCGRVLSRSSESVFH